MRLRICSLILFSAFTSGSLFGQNLDQLTSRVLKLWEVRSRTNRLEALQFIERPTQETYLQLNEAPFSSFKLSGIDFSGDPDRVDVMVTVHGLVPGVGEIDRVVRETWVRKDGEWLMHAAPAPTPFGSDAETRAAHVPPPFQITQTVIDIGRHAQGETVEGTISFKAPRSEIRLIRPVQKIPGLTIGSPVWSDPNTGLISYRWETTLVSQNVSQKLTLEAIATSDVPASVDLEFRVRIDGKVSFQQIPEIIDPATAGQVELQLQNLTDKPLKILTVMSYNSSYVIDDNVPESIEPGKSGRLLIRYSAQTQPTGAMVGLVLSENLTPSGITGVPINVKIPEEKRVSYSQEELKQFSDKTKPPAAAPLR